MPASFLLSSDPILPPPSGCATEQGAALVFLGIVRGSEQGQAILGIEYSAYAPMAEKELTAILAEVTDESAAVFVQHRLGFVPVGEPSLLIEVRTKHSALAFERCQSCLVRIKERLPIWKRFVETKNETPNSEETLIETLSVLTDK